MMNPHLRLPLWVAILVGLLFSSTIDHPFHFDDEHSITRNPHIRPPVDWEMILSDPAAFSRNPGSGMYRPVVLASYVGNAALGGLDPRGWHVVNVLVHVVCTLLVGALARHMGADGWAACLAALLFGLHPIVAEPVNYISSRSESMALLFSLGSILMYLRGNGRPRYHAGSTVLFALGLGCKATGVLPLPLLLLYEAAAGRLRRHWRRWTPLAALALIHVGFVRHLWQEAIIDAPVRTQTEQLLTQSKALVYYTKLLLMPVGLTVEHAFQVATDASHAVVLAAIGFAASLLWLCLKLRRRRWGFVVFWPALGLLPTIVIPLNVLVSEHRLYPALAGLALLVGLGVHHLPRHVSRLATAGLLILALLSVDRNAAWSSEQALWSEAAERGGSVRALVRLGVFYRQTGDLDLAEQYLRRALYLSPDHAPALNNLGNVLRSKGHLTQAQQMYEAALRQLPDYPEALINLGSLLAGRSETDRARQLYVRATQVAPEHFEGWNNLATLLLRQGQGTEAEAALRQGLLRQPDSAPMLFNLSGALELQNRQHEAIAALQRAVAVDAGYARAWLHLGNLLRAQGRSLEAADAYERFLSTYHGDRAVADRVRAMRQELIRRGDG